MRALMTAELAKRLGVSRPRRLAQYGQRSTMHRRVVSRSCGLKPDPARFGASVVKAGGGIMPFFPVIDG